MSTATVPTNQVRRRRRRNRLFLLGLLITPLIFALLIYLAATSQPTPNVDPLSVPAGYRPITNPYFGFAIPRDWKKNAAYTDQAGDIFYGGASGWVGETLIAKNSHPTVGEALPPAVEDFAQKTPTPYSVAAGHPTKVKGTAWAEEYTITRPDGFRALAIDAWERSTQTELWLVIDTDATTLGSITASLTGISS